MYIPSTDTLEQDKSLAKLIMDNKDYVLEGIVTSVDPNQPYKVKVMLYPYEIESGWLRIASPYVGSGFGLIVPPPEEGTAVMVIFHMGDISNGIVVSGLWNDEINMPNVPYGTAGIIDKSGTSIFINPDGSITLDSSGVVNVNAGIVNLGGSDGKPVARVGDSVDLGTGKITSGSSKVNSA
jgi:hypothetical protein